MTPNPTPGLAGRSKHISGVNDMNNQEQFTEFLRCCREQRATCIHLAELSLLVNPSAGDFGSIILEFGRCKYFVTSKYLPHTPDDEEIDEFCVKKFEQFSELQEDGLSEKGIYKTISAQEHPLEFLTELVDADGHFNGMEWKYEDGYLFFTVSCPVIVAHAAFDEELKHLLYPHQFGESSNSPLRNHKYYELFPDA